MANLADNGMSDDSIAPAGKEKAFSDVTYDDASHAVEVNWPASVGMTKGWANSDSTWELRRTNNVARQGIALIMYSLCAFL